MIDWAFVLTPLLVLPIALMFSFVGCSDFGEGPSAVVKPPRYRDYIMGVHDNPGTVPHPDFKPNVADVIAYWRLVDDAANTVMRRVSSTAPMSQKAMPRRQAFSQASPGLSRPTLA